jgi:MinD-like ATPase involved in chromosome partitioning or flagellar assembly
MAIFTLTTGADPAKVRIVEQQIRRAIPGTTSIADIAELSDVVASRPDNWIYLLVIASSDGHGHFKALTEAASSHLGSIFFILVSDEISASDYKALVRRGDADWVSLGADPREILEIVTRHRQRQKAESAGDPGGARPIAISFVPSAGGVGNTTLALEIAIKLKTAKATRDRAICIVDLNFQGSNVCDYLDIEPRLKIQEILDHPERLDAQLFDIFISRHASGLHVFAAPRSKLDLCNLRISAIDAFFDLASQRYDLILIDLPVTWFAWTDPVVAASDGVIVTGLNTIPGLRQTVETLAAVRAAGGSALRQLTARDEDGGQGLPTGQIAVAINRCRRRFTGGILHRHHVEAVLDGERVFYVDEEPAALESINTGMPIGLVKTGGPFTKGIAALAAFCGGLVHSRARSD